MSELSAIDATFLFGFGRALSRALSFETARHRADFFETIRTGLN